MYTSHYQTPTDPAKLNGWKPQDLAEALLYCAENMHWGPEVNVGLWAEALIRGGPPQVETLDDSVRAAADAIMRDFALAIARGEIKAMFPEIPYV